MKNPKIPVSSFLAQIPRVADSIMLFLPAPGELPAATPGFRYGSYPPGPLTLVVQRIEVEREGRKQKTWRLAERVLQTPRSRYDIPDSTCSQVSRTQTNARFSSKEITDNKKIKLFLLYDLPPPPPPARLRSTSPEQTSVFATINLK